MGNCTGQTTQFLQQQKLPKKKTNNKTKQKDGEETDKMDLKTYQPNASVGLVWIWIQPTIEKRKHEANRENRNL